MAKDEQTKKLNAEIRILANKIYPTYKDFIANELFFSEFGVSYKTIDEFKESWRKIVKYSQKCEDFIKFKTKIFLRMLPVDNPLYSHPRFLRVLIKDICNYIAHFIAQKDNSLEIPEIANKLYSELYDEKYFIQHKQKPIVSGKQQNAPTTKRPRKRINQVDPTNQAEEEPVEPNKPKKPFLTPDEEEKARRKMEYIHKIIMKQHNLTVCASVNTIEK